tara:strand:+ start:95 stop:712 length:618 start_codon:yes stop_codon:yes gene_type:complete
MRPYGESAQPTNKQASSIQQATIMADWSLYPNATEPTAPRFQVGELVHTHSSQHESTVEPAVFGVIIEEPEEGTIVQDSSTMPRSWDREWEGVENPYEEADIDLPGSGSVWFLPDNERKYFVKWMNKETYPVNTQPTEFRPMMTNGEPTFNISLHFEDSLYKAPNFIAKLRSKVAQRKEVEEMLTERLNIDECSTQGIAGMVMQY